MGPAMLRIITSHPKCLGGASQDQVGCLRSLPVGEQDASGRNPEQTVRLSWELLQLAKKNTKGRVCLKFFSFCSLGIFLVLMACRAVLMSARVSGPRSTLTCSGTAIPPFTTKTQQVLTSKILLQGQNTDSVELIPAFFLQLDIV